MDAKMASVDEIQDVGCEEEFVMEEVEIEYIPADPSMDSTVVDAAIDPLDSMLAFQTDPVVVHEEVVLLQTAEEVVGGGSLVYVDSLTGVPDMGLDVPTDYVSESVVAHSYDRRAASAGKGGRRKGGRSRLNHTGVDADLSDLGLEPNQVQIKTLDGEFSVTMWGT